MVTPSVFLSDPDVTLWHGDVLETLRELPAESVDCVVTSPPYWGLRDYGTGAWDGGDAGCDHAARRGVFADGCAGCGCRMSESTEGCRNCTERHRLRGKLGTAPDRDYEPFDSEKSKSSKRDVTAAAVPSYRDTCGKCGATRIDQQLGLEPTPEQYVERMVEVFREVRRVLAAHGTVWLNLGDSYVANSMTAGSQMGSVQADTAGLGRKSRGVSNCGIRGHNVLKTKDLVGIPWRVAFALQADGWYLRSDIIWSKPNPMPESVTDRPTKAHEYVFLLSKQARYFFDQEAVREANSEWTEKALRSNWSRKTDASVPTDLVTGERWRISGALTAAGRDYKQGLNPAGRNIRSVWEIATQPYPEAHFATFPEELARRAIAAGCPEQVCRVCGKARERITSTEYENPGNRRNNGKRDGEFSDQTVKVMSGGQRLEKRVTTEGFTDCGHADYRPGITLDPFVGSGTVAFVARKLNRHSIGIDLSAEYLALAARRLQQQSLFAEVAS